MSLNVRSLKSFKKFLCFFTVVIVLFCGLFFLKGYLEGHFDSVDALKIYIADFGILGPFFLSLIQGLQVILPVLPGIFGCIVGVELFGTTVGFLCNYIGISAGSIAAFFLAKRFGLVFVRQMFSIKRYRRLIGWVNRKKNYSMVLFTAILLPLAPDDALCYFSGLTKISVWKYVWIILLAKPWCILAYTLVFASIF